MLDVDLPLGQLVAQKPALLGVLERFHIDHATLLEESLGVRVSKRMSELGMASRREADEWIARGWVFVDGAPVELGTRVLPHSL